MTDRPGVEAAELGRAVLEAAKVENADHAAMRRQAIAARCEVALTRPKKGGGDGGPQR